MEAKFKSTIRSTCNPGGVFCAVAIVLQFGVLAGYAQAVDYLYSGAKTTITLNPGLWKGSDRRLVQLGKSRARPLCNPFTGTSARLSSSFLFGCDYPGLIPFAIAENSPSVGIMNRHLPPLRDCHTARKMMKS
jgi:hypothetical protein